jgi:endoplasmic reticulum-Golgi intermediate compartment protein 3
MRSREPFQSPPSNGFLDKIKVFDFFHKTDEQLPTERSTLGGFFTLFIVFLLLYLLFSEFNTYTDVYTEDVLTVDLRRGGLLQIHLDVQFFNLSCEFVAMDVVDGVSGDTLMEAAHQIIKQRLSHDGVSLSEKRQAGV